MDGHCSKCFWAGSNCTVVVAIYPTKVPMMSMAIYQTKVPVVTMISKPTVPASLSVKVKYFSETTEPCQQKV